MNNKAIKTAFPSQAVPDMEKASAEYGAKVGKAIEHEWFTSNNATYNRYGKFKESFHSLRLYARGEQSIKKYKDELLINGDLSYLNLDWKPVPIIPKFVDIVVNGMADRGYSISAYSQDPFSVVERTRYLENMMADMQGKSIKEEVKNVMGIDTFNNDPSIVPETPEELSLHMQLNYKQSIEIAEEEAINSVFDKNKYDTVRDRFNYDLTVIGIGAVKTSFNKAEGIKIEYVDPADMVYSPTESPFFDDIYYVGEVKDVYVNDLKKQFPELTDEQLDEYRGYYGGYTNRSDYRGKADDNNTIRVLYFEYKTYKNQVYKLKNTPTGGQRAVKKDDTFDPPENDMFEKIDRAIEVIYEGVKILGSGDKSTNYNPQEALNMYFQTGSVIGRSMTQDGDFNRGTRPVSELTSSGKNNKIASLIQTYNYYLQMIRDVTGLNEARDGALPDERALVGLQKLAAANSNTATRHILNGSLYLTLSTAECISMRVADVIEYSPTRDSFIRSLGKFNVSTLNEMANLHMHDFGIFLELAPDEEEKQRLENNIQVALQSKQIHLDDAIDVREVKNIKLANQLLKIRRLKKQATDQQLAQQNIQAQANANAQTAERAAAAEMQKQQALAQTEIQVQQSKSQFEIQKLEREAAIKKELMELEFSFNLRLKEAEVSGIKQREREKEDRKDERTKIQATQQSELIEQRKKETGPKNFESAGFDNLGGFGLEQFEPR